MKTKSYSFFLIVLFLLGFSCANPTEQNPTNNTVESFSYQVDVHDYAPMSIPDFFVALIKNHKKDYVQFSNKAYFNICKQLDLDPKNENNQHAYYSIQILHDLFTSSSASTCSVGEVWTIPYQWHWISSNPRHEIYLKETDILLKDLPPLKGFSKYNSYADIDRTPFLFLSDLFVESPKYYSEDCGDFSTFGWCSEREMAFISLIKILNFTGKVKAAHGHSWSELIIPMQTTTGKTKDYKVRVDNTFDGIEWQNITTNDLKEWQKNMGDSKIDKWYNEKALSTSEHQKIKNYIVSSKTMKNLELQLVNYLNKKIKNTHLLDT